MTRPTMRSAPARLAAGSCLACVAAFVGLLLLAWHRPGSPGFGDYLSELGVAGQPSAGAYRLALVSISGAVALAAATGRWDLAPPRVVAALSASALPFAVSAAVPCAAGCPIPVRDGWGTPANLVHFTASAAGFGGAVLAMALTGRVRRWSAVAARLAAGLIVVFAGFVLILGHGVPNGVVERLLALTCVTWLVAYVARPPGRHRRVVSPPGSVTAL